LALLKVLMYGPTTTIGICILDYYTVIHIT